MPVDKSSIPVDMFHDLQVSIVSLAFCTRIRQLCKYP